MNLPKEIPNHDTIQRVINILGAGWTVAQVIKQPVTDSYAVAILRMAEHLDWMEQEASNAPVEIADEGCDCGEHSSSELPVVMTWAWKRACKRAHHDPDGPMTSATKRALLVASKLIEQHEKPPVTMADLISKAIDEGSLQAYHGAGTSYWPGSTMIVKNSMGKMMAADERIKQFLMQEVYE